MGSILVFIMAAAATSSVSVSDAVSTTEIVEGNSYTLSCAAAMMRVPPTSAISSVSVIKSGDKSLFYYSSRRKIIFGPLQWIYKGVGLDPKPFMTYQPVNVKVTIHMYNLNPGDSGTYACVIQFYLKGKNKKQTIKADVLKLDVTWQNFEFDFLQGVWGDETSGNESDSYSKAINCPANATYEKVKDTCQCEQNGFTYNDVSNTCECNQLCPEDMVPNEFTCECGCEEKCPAGTKRLNAEGCECVETTRAPVKVSKKPFIPNVTCAEGWTFFAEEPTCVKMVHNKLTWCSARDYCKTQGGDLVTILSSAFDHFLTALMSSRESFWIGLNDREMEAAFNWLDGFKIPVYTNWAMGSPDGFEDKNCVEKGLKGNGYWNDVDCEISLKFICERRIEQKLQGETFKEIHPTPRDNRDVLYIFLALLAIVVLGICILLMIPTRWCVDINTETIDEPDDESDTSGNSSVLIGWTRPRMVPPVGTTKYR